VRAAFNRFPARCGLHHRDLFVERFHAYRLRLFQSSSVRFGL
jgi:hypothetical protein